VGGSGVLTESDPAARRALVDEVFTEDARYTDPLADVAGREAIAAVQAQFPGFGFRLAGPVDAHHDQVRFTWHLGPDGAEAPIAGFDASPSPTGTAGSGRCWASSTGCPPPPELPRKRQLSSTRQDPTAV